MREAYADATECAHDMRKREKTAEFWFAGTHAPRGATVAAFFQRFPDIAARHLTTDG